MCFVNYELKKMQYDVKIAYYIITTALVACSNRIKLRQSSVTIIGSQRRDPNTESPQYETGIPVSQSRYSIFIFITRTTNITN
jgi:hypothetical protein